MDGTEFLTGCQDYFMGFPGKFNYLRCRNCQLVQIDPVPENIMQFYRKYFSHDQKSALHGLFRRKLLMAGYAIPEPGTTPLKILDYGCGDGWYLEHVQNLGHKVCGFEPAPGQAEALASTRAFEIFEDRESMIRQKHGSIDLVTMHFVLEHATDLQVCFEDARVLLRPGGNFHVLIPSLQSAGFRIFGRWWHGLDAPRHISFPHREVLERLGLEHQLEFVSLRRVPMPNVFAGSLSTMVRGKFSYPLFCLFILPAVIFSKIAPGESVVANFVRS